MLKHAKIYLIQIKSLKILPVKKKKSTHVEWLNENAGVIELFVIIDHDLR